MATPCGVRARLGNAEMMQRLNTECVMRTAVARDNFAQFCELHVISVTDQPRFDVGIAASWREEVGDADRRLLYCARHPRSGCPGTPDRTEWFTAGFA